MNNKFNSLVEVNKDIVIRGANNCINYIQKKRNEALERLIVRAMKPTKILGLTLHKGCPREDAINYINKYSNVRDDDYIDYTIGYFNEFEDAQELLAAAHLAEKYVYLSRADAALVEKWKD